jgi:chromate transporter
LDPHRKDERQQDYEVARKPTFGEAARTWARIGLLGFGGPAGQIALMHRELVEERRWISESRFLHALNYCMLLPGPEAQQLATYIGWLLHRTPGGIVAGTLFVLPGFLVVLALSAAYVQYRELPWVAVAFVGLKAAVIAIVVDALIRIARRAIRGKASVPIAAAAFTALFFFEISFPVVILAAALFGFFAGGRVFPPTAAMAYGSAAERGTVVGEMFVRGEMADVQATGRRAARVVATWLALWALPVVGAFVLFGGDSVFVEASLFFSRAAVVTFGGAYAVLAYVAQQAVAVYGWLQPGEMLDGLGLAETTPGPLILVLQFVGFLAAYRHPGALDPMLAGTLGAALTVWVTFTPCFLWIFLGAPYVESLRGKVRVQDALSAITPAVVGVIANLTAWFALHALFGSVDAIHWGPLRVLLPSWPTLDWVAVALTALSVWTLFGLRWSIPRTLLAGAASALALHAIVRA